MCMVGYDKLCQATLSGNLELYKYANYVSYCDLAHLAVDNPKGILEGNLPDTCYSSSVPTTSVGGESSENGEDTECPPMDPHEDPTEGDGENLYVCSPSASTNCQENNLNDPDKCWSTQGTVPCVYAPSLEDAQYECACDCVAQQEVFKMNCSGDDPSDQCYIEEYMNCTVGQGVTPQLKTTCDGYTCMGVEGQPPPAGVNCLDSVPFVAKGALLIEDGSGAVHNTLVRGYIGYNTSNCITGTSEPKCDFTVHTLQVSHDDLVGKYLSGTGNAEPFDITQLDGGMIASLNGVWYPDTKAVVFPNGNLSFHLSTPNADLGVGGAIWGNSPLLVTNQIVGAMNNAGDLSLTFTMSYYNYLNGHGTFWVTLETLPEPESHP